MKVVWKTGVACGLLIVGLAVIAFLWRPGFAGREEIGQPSGQKPDVRMPDCGAACLYLICKASGQQQSLSFLRELTNTTALATTMYNVKEAAEQLGFRVEACRGTFASLHEHVKQPNHYAILHYQMGHFVAVMGVSGKERVRVVDVGAGIQDLNDADLHKEGKWQGAMLLLATPEDPE
jgi:ABC-type bacteriocin/lantibiotic exporter with double-glycine peptidase domain